MARAEAVLCLLSSDLLGDGAYSQALNRIVRRHQGGEVLVIPILARPVQWQDSVLGAMKILPTDQRPVSAWAREDEAWVDVVQGIKHSLQHRIGQVRASMSPGDRPVPRPVAPCPARSLTPDQLYEVRRTLTRLLPLIDDIRAYAQEAGILVLPDEKAADVLWAEILRIMKNEDRDLSPLLSTALQRDGQDSLLRKLAGWS